MKKNVKKVISFILSMLVIISTAVTPAMAAGTKEAPTEVKSVTASGLWTTVLNLEFEDTTWMDNINKVNPSNPNGDKNVTDKKVSNNTNNVKPVVKNVAAKNNKNVPKTGDNANVLLWIALAVISCGVLAGAGVAVRKRK